MSENNSVMLDVCLNNFKTTNDLTQDNGELFEIFSLYQLTKKYNLPYNELEDCIVDGGGDGGIDTFSIIVQDTIINTEDDIDNISFNSNTRAELILGQAKCDKSFKENVLDKFIVSIPLIYNLSLDEKALNERFNIKIIDKIFLFRKIWEKIIINSGIIHITYYHATKANQFTNDFPAYQSKIIQICKDTQDKITDVIVDFKCVSSRELLELYKTKPVTKLNLEFKENPMPITYDQSDGIGFIGVVKLRDFRNFIINQDNDLRENIFESNVRHYQGNVDVNKKIKTTLESDMVRDFWWMNNGITIIATDARPFGKRLVLDDPQIVNGLQTSFTLYHYYSELEEAKDDNRSVLVKIIQSSDKNTIDKIISSTNNQSVVSPILLRATEDLQRNIEDYFFSKGYFYDRRKNFYKNQGKSLSKIFSIQFTGQAVEAIMNSNPSAARSQPTTLMKKDKSYKLIFNEGINLNVYLNCDLIVTMVKKYMRINIDSNDVMKNFLYHLSRTAVSISLNKFFVTPTDLANISISKFSDEIMDNTVILLKSILNSYIRNNQDENIINISKSQKFTDHLIQELKLKYTV